MEIIAAQFLYVDINMRIKIIICTSFMFFASIPFLIAQTYTLETTDENTPSGTLELTCDTDGEFYLDNKHIGRVFHTRKTTINRIPVGPHVAEIRYWRLTDRKEVTIEQDSIVTVEFIGPLEVEMVRIDGGIFTMGSPVTETNREDDEGPQRRVTVNPFYISKFEITQYEWNLVMEKDNPSWFKGENRPVEQVTWFDTLEFCNALSLKEDLVPAYKINGRNISWYRTANGYRLPTEAEWEYAARAGTVTTFHYGNNLDSSMANFNGNYPYGHAPRGEFRKETMDVGSFNPNIWGLYDMHGNVWEWCWDWFGEYSQRNTINPQGPPTGIYRVLRGGSWYYDAKYLRAAYRYINHPEYSSYNIGFRIVRSAN